MTPSCLGLPLSISSHCLLLNNISDSSAKSLGEKHLCVVASQAPPIGDLAHNPGMCPDWELNWRPFCSQAGAQSTEPHQPGLALKYSLKKIVFRGY